jgi:hypothetical protein
MTPYGPEPPYPGRGTLTPHPRRYDEGGVRHHASGGVRLPGQRAVSRLSTCAGTSGETSARRTGDLLDQARGEEGVLRAGRHEDGLDADRLEFIWAICSS